jgi:hypothetical protein
MRIRELLGALGAAPAEQILAHLGGPDGDGLLARVYAELGTRFPGRSEALIAVARVLGTCLPPSEYVLREDTLDGLLERAQATIGARLQVRGPAGHKGRVGDAVERLLVGGRTAGRRSDHPEAEIKSVPVLGGDVLERVKLGVVSPTSNPLDKCGRVLFVFVEARGAHFFVRGIGLREFDGATWRSMWRDGWLVETSAGTVAAGARGLYLIPRWFRHTGLWPLGIGPDARYRREP